MTTLAVERIQRQNEHTPDQQKIAIGLVQQQLLELGEAWMPAWFADRRAPCERVLRRKEESA